LLAALADRPDLADRADGWDDFADLFAGSLEDPFTESLADRLDCAGSLDCADFLDGADFLGCLAAMARAHAADDQVARFLQGNPAAAP
jgi:hypothetical protein